jgi:CRP/FNR family transcriptional regulator, cyclic AMP receptor protein
MMINQRKSCKQDEFQDVYHLIPDTFHYTPIVISIILDTMIIKDKLIKTSLFYDLTDDQLDSLARLAVPCNFAKDEMLFEQNQYAEFLYIVLSGEISIRFKPHDGDEIPVARVTELGICGWSSVLGRAIYTSAAVCSQPCETLRFRGRELLKLCESFPDTGIIIMERLAAVIAERLSNTNEQIMLLLSQNLVGKKEFLRRRNDDNRQP